MAQVFEACGFTYQVGTQVLVTPCDDQAVHQGEIIAIDKFDDCELYDIVIRTKDGRIVHGYECYWTKDE